MISTGTVNEIEPTPKAKDQGYPSLILCFGRHLGQLETHLVALMVVPVTYWWIGQVRNAIGPLERSRAERLILSLRRNCKRNRELTEVSIAAEVTSPSMVCKSSYTNVCGLKGVRAMRGRLRKGIRM